MDVTYVLGQGGTEEEVFQGAGEGEDGGEEGETEGRLREEEREAEEELRAQVEHSGRLQRPHVDHLCRPLLLLLSLFSPIQNSRIFQKVFIRNNLHFVAIQKRTV